MTTRDFICLGTLSDDDFWLKYEMVIGGNAMIEVNKVLLNNWIDYISKSPEERLQMVQLHGKIKCPFCGKEFNNEKEAFDHMRDEHQQDDPEDLKLT